MQPSITIMDTLKRPARSRNKLGQSKWTLVAILFLISALNYGDRSVLSSIVPVLQHTLHFSDIQIGLLSTGFLWTYAISVLLGGYLGDTLSRSRLITFSLAAWSGATLLAGFTQSFSQLFLCRVLLGLAESFYIPAALALTADHHESRTRGVALAINLSGMNAGLIAGAVVGGWMAERYRWQSPFIVLGILGIVMIPVSWLFIHDLGPQADCARRPSPPILSTLVQLLRCRSYILVVLAAMLKSSGLWVFWTWLPLFYHDAFHMSLSESGFSGTFVLQSAAMAAIVTGGYFSDRIGANRPKRRLMALSLFYFASVPFLGVFYGRHSYITVSTGIFLSSFLRTFGQGNESPIICDLLLPQLRSIALGISLAFEMVGGGVAVLFAAYLKQHYGLRFAFLCTAGFVVFAALSALIACLWCVDRDLRCVSGDEREHVTAEPAC